MVPDGSVTRMIHLIRSGDPAERDMAARLIWLRYFRELLELARSNLDRRIRRREDEEDVVQSMYKSFCLRQQRGGALRRSVAMGIQIVFGLLDGGVTGMKITDTARMHHRLAVDQSRQEKTDQQQENTGNPDRPVPGSAWLRVHASTVNHI